MPIITLTEAINLVQKGGIIAYPTEAVYGLGCNPFHLDAVARLRQLKGRDDGRGFIVIASHWQQVASWVVPLDVSRMDEIVQSWPSHNTWIFQASNSAPLACTAEDHSIAIRVTAHPLVVALCDQLNHPLVSTSANPNGQPPARTPDEVWAYFHNEIDGIVEGDLAGEAQPSRIRDARSGAVIR